MHADYNLNMKCHALTGIFEKCAAAAATASFTPRGQSVYDRTGAGVSELGPLELWGSEALKLWSSGAGEMDMDMESRISISHAMGSHKRPATKAANRNRNLCGLLYLLRGESVRGGSELGGDDNGNGIGIGTGNGTAR